MSEENRFIDPENMSEGEQYKLITKAMNKKTQKDFYEKLRVKVQKYINEHPNSEYINYLIAAPDFFHLLCKLLADNRVPLKNKVYIAAAILYFVSPLDLITDIIPGIGFADDVIIAVNVIKMLLDSVDEEVIDEYWVGEGRVIEQLKNLLDLADSVVGKGIVQKIKGFFGK